MDVNIIWRVLLFSITTIYCADCFSICERTPIHTTAKRKPGDNGFAIRILDLPKNGKYVPEEIYTGTSLIYEFFYSFNFFRLLINPCDKK